MAGQSFVKFGWSWNEASVLGSQVLGQVLMESFESGVQSEVQSGYGPESS